MGIFDNLDDADVFEKSQYFQEGQYVVRIRKVKYNESGFKGASFVVETEVVGVHSEHDDAPQIGATAAHVWNAGNGKEDIARSTWMQFITAATGKGQKELTGAQWAKASANATGDKQPLTGKLMRLDVFMTTTKAGNPFTNHKWLREAAPDDLAAFDVAV
jgi:hypothetical protein